MEQILFRGQVMKMCGTISKKAHKSVLGANSTLRKFSKSKLLLQFVEADFGLMQLVINYELADTC